jgi:polyisoprenoid-binding protein YceI
MLRIALRAFRWDAREPTTVARRNFDMATYSIDNAHSDVAFSVRHMVFAKVRGHFNKWSATLAFDAADPSKSSVEVEIDAGSIDTREAQRDGHLKSPDFLDVEKFPKMTFKSKKVERAGDKYKVTGALTIHGVTKDAVLDVEETGRGKDPWGNSRVGFAAKTTIVREDFGLKWNQVLETGGVLVGEKIEVEIEVEAVEKK